MPEVAVDRALWNTALNQIARRTFDHRNSEDLLHSAYIRMSVYQQTHQVDCAVSFLTRTAINIGIDDHRHESFLKNHVIESSLCFDNPAPLQDKVMEDRDRLNRLKAGLEELPARTREIFLLSRVEELRHREIAKLLGVSVSAVEKHLAKAVPFLSEWMKGW